MGRLCALDHALGQFQCGLNVDRVGEVSGLSARQSGAPVLGQGQRTINERVALFGDGGEKHAHRTVFHRSGASALLRPDACGGVAPCGEAAFIDDAHRERSGGIRTPGGRRRGRERLAQERAEHVTNAVLVPGGSREQALDARRMRQPGVFGDLPAMVARNLAENGLQGEHGMLGGFRTRDVGTQTLMELLHAKVPAVHGFQDGLNGFCGGIVGKKLPAFLAFDGSRNEAVSVLLACHIGTRMARSFC